MSTSELAELPIGQRSSHRRDDRLEPGLAQRDDVCVALHHGCEVLLADRGLGEVKPVQDGALVEEVALGRVDVLAPQRVVLAQLAGLEAHHAAARVGEREHEPVREVVRAPRRHEAG